MLFFACDLQLPCGTVMKSTVIKERYTTKQYRYSGAVQYTVPGVQYSTVQHTVAQYSTVHGSTVQYSTVQYAVLQYSTV